jgi:hypothetical protein
MPFAASPRDGIFAASATSPARELAALGHGANRQPSVLIADKDAVVTACATRRVREASIKPAARQEFIRTTRIDRGIGGDGPDVGRITVIVFIRHRARILDNAAAGPAAARG